MGIDNITKPQLTLGPILFNWATDVWQDFYFRIADEAPVETVYLGEIVCFKRGMLFLPVMDKVIQRLEAAGKKVVLSTLALAMNDKCVRFIENIVAKGSIVEANDMTAVSLLAKTNHPYAIGPYINTYNEGTLDALKKKNATHVCLPFELSGENIKVLAKHAQKIGMTSEVMVYGRAPLAISARCYHARLHGKDQQGCQFVCLEDPEGVPVSTMSDQDFLIVNGKQTLGHTCTNLVKEISQMVENGVTHFRLSPHTGDMVHVANAFDGVIKQHTTNKDALLKLKESGFDAAFSNGYYHGKPGHEWVE